MSEERYCQYSLLGNLITILFVIMVFVAACCTISCTYDQAALLAELDSRFTEQRVRINSMVEKEIEQERMQHGLFAVDTLLRQNRLADAKIELQLLDGNPALTIGEQMQITMVLKQMERK